jgi:hypothetical protein
MPSLDFQIISWPALGVALLVFGFAPGAVLRLIVLAYPRDDPRRRELLGELYAVPRIERPFWVIEQLEVALFEGLRGRIAAGIVAWRMQSPRRWKKVPGFLAPNDTRFLVANEGVYVASKHIEVDRSYIPVRHDLARPVLEEMAADAQFLDLPRRARKMVIKLLTEGPEKPWPPTRTTAFYSRIKTCPVCGAEDCYQL